MLLTLIVMFCRFADRVIMFHETLQFRTTIVLCYNKKTIVKVIGIMPPPLTYQISQSVVDCLFKKLSMNVF
jgi:hypothetical protein